MKYYFKDNDNEWCYTKASLIKEAKLLGDKELIIYEAVKEKVEGNIWCKAWDVPTESEDCGWDCERYEPRNKVKGCCKHRGDFYTPGKRIVIKIKETK